MTANKTKEPIIIVKGLQKTFDGELEVLKGIDIEIDITVRVQERKVRIGHFYIHLFRKSYPSSGGVKMFAC